MQRTIKQCDECKKETIDFQFKLTSLCGHLKEFCSIQCVRTYVINHEDCCGTNHEFTNR